MLKQSKWIVIHSYALAQTSDASFKKNPRLLYIHYVSWNDSDIFSYNSSMCCVILIFFDRNAS